MTGIERLREFVAGISPITTVCGVTKSSYDREHMEEAGYRLRDFLGDIADQIAREHAEDCFRMGERAADVSMSAYDLLPADEREAISWVYEHGGISEVKKEWSHYRNLKNQLKKAKDSISRQQRHIESIQSKLRERRERIEELNRELDELDDICGGESVKDTLDEALNLCATIGCEPSCAVGEGLVWALGECTEIVGKRLMPEGMEWPRFEDGEPVRFGDEFIDHHGIERSVLNVKMWQEGGFEIGTGQGTYDWHKAGERVKRPAKVLDADGVEISEGDTVWTTRDLDKFTVTNPNNGKFLSVSCKGEDGEDYCCYPTDLTHRAPVLAADGRPLREGETVWVTMDNPHMAPLLKGDEVTVRFVPHNIVSVEDDKGSVWYVGSDDLTHERPETDSWERLEEDVRDIWNEVRYHLGDYSPSDFKEKGDSVCDRIADLPRRIRALAGDA